MLQVKRDREWREFLDGRAPDASSTKRGHSQRAGGGKVSFFFTAHTTRRLLMCRLVPFGAYPAAGAEASARGRAGRRLGVILCALSIAGCADVSHQLKFGRLGILLKSFFLFLVSFCFLP